MRSPDSSNQSWRRRDLIKLLGATAIARTNGLSVATDLVETSLGVTKKADEKK